MNGFIIKLTVFSLFMGIVLGLFPLNAQVKIHNNKRYEKISGEWYFTKNGITENRIQKEYCRDMVCQI